MMKKNLPKLLALFIGLLVILTTSKAQVNLSVLNNTFTESFDSLSATGTANDTTTLPKGWVFLETGSNANVTYAAGTGSSTAGNTYSLGVDSDRAFGGLQSGSLIPVIGARFKNNTGATITSIRIGYTGEQWRLGASPRAQADRLDFQYSLTASSLSTGTWIDDDSLDFSSPVTSGTVGVLNGNSTSNRTTKQHLISGLAIPNGATLWIRWNDFNVASSDDALAVDNFSITPMGTPTDQTAIVLAPGKLNFGEVNVNTSKVLSYTVNVTHATDSFVYISTRTRAFLLSLDNITYSDSLTATSTDTVYVKFSPLNNGSIADSIFHYSSGLSKALPVAGSGFDPLNNIISIAEARSKSSGTKVTVAGRITVANQQGSPSFVQDATGGIPVFDYTFSNAIAIGDSVIVTGTIGLFNDQKQIGGSVTFSRGDSLKRFITPKPILIGELAGNEGLLVTVQHVQLVNKSFVFYPQSTEQMQDSTLQADVRIDGDTDIPGLSKPQGTVNITGVVGRFKTNAQLLPRFRSDIPGAVEPQTPFDSIPKANTFDLMNWNLEFFGATREDYPQEYGPVDEPLQLHNVQQVISAVHADVIAVQEVSNDSLFAALLLTLPDYKAVCSDRYSYSFQGPDSTFPPQKVCFIYDSATVKVESYRAMFENRYDSARTVNSALLPAYPTGDASSFWSSGRLPFMLTAQVTVNGVTERIRFINLHAKSGATVADYNRRVYDAQVLKDSLDAHYAADKIVILGDYNDDLEQSIVTGLPTSYAAFVQDTIAYIPVTRALSLAGAKSTVSFDGVIDNQIISNELHEYYLSGSERVLTPFLEIRNYATTTSDHLPVVTRFAFAAEPLHTFAYFTASAKTVVEGYDSIPVNVQLTTTAITDRVIYIGVDSTSTVYSSDYITSPAAVNHVLQLVVPAGRSSASLWINVLDDTLDEQDETVTLTIITSADAAATDSSTFVLTIQDNDPATIAFEEAEVSREEGSEAYAVKLKLSSPQATQQTVTLQATNGQGVYYGNIFDYTTSPAVKQNKIVLAIPAGADEVEFRITPNRDLLHENNEVVTFSIVSVSGGLAKGTIASFKLNIVDVPVCLPIFGVFPNPTFGHVNIYTLPVNENNIIYGTLLDSSGEPLYAGEGTAAQLSEKFTTALQGKKNGIYIVKLKACDQVIIIRIIKL